MYKKLFLLILIFLSLFSFVNSATTINSLPYDITISGDYIINSNLTTPLNSRGVLISVSNVNIVCNGYTLSGNGSSSYGIGNSVSNIHYINISNCNFKNFSSGLYLRASQGRQIHNITAYNNINGIYLESIISGLNMSNVTLYNNSGKAIYFYANLNYILDELTIYNNSEGIYNWQSRNGNITNSNFYDNINYSIYFYGTMPIFMANATMLYNNYFDNFSKINAYNWSYAYPNYFNSSTQGNTYGVGSESLICFDAPQNLVCDYHPNYLVNNGTSQQNLNSIFPNTSNNSIFLIFGIILSYFLLF